MGRKKASAGVERWDPRTRALHWEKQHLCHPCAKTLSKPVTPCPDPNPPPTPFSLPGLLHLFLALSIPLPCTLSSPPATSTWDPGAAAGKSREVSVSDPGPGWQVATPSRPPRTGRGSPSVSKAEVHPHPVFCLFEEGKESVHYGHSGNGVGDGGQVLPGS
jgi:hypothetical protein